MTDKQLFDLADRISKEDMKRYPAIYELEETTEYRGRVLYSTNYYVVGKSRLLHTMHHIPMFRLTHGTNIKDVIRLFCRADFGGLAGIKIPGYERTRAGIRNICEGKYSTPVYYSLGQDLPSIDARKLSEIQKAFKCSYAWIDGEKYSARDPDVIKSPVYFFPDDEPDTEIWVMMLPIVGILAERASSGFYTPYFKKGDNK